jgi:hypothetical protein
LNSNEDQNPEIAVAMMNGLPVEQIAKMKERIAREQEILRSQGAATQAAIEAQEKREQAAREAQQRTDREASEKYFAGLAKAKAEREAITAATEPSVLLARLEAIEQRLAALEQ